MKKNEDDIDLINVILLLWKKKWNIIFFVFSSMIISYLILVQINKTPVKKLVSSEIKSITAYEENQYRLWNFFLRSIVNDDIFYVDHLDLDGMIENQKIEFLLDKDLLFDLFVAKLNQRDYLENSLKKFTYLKAEDYPSLLDYEAAISDLASEIKITLNNEYKGDDKKEIAIEFRTYDLKKWINFLRFVQAEINEEIRKKLIEMYGDYTSYLDLIKKYNIDDLKYKILVTSNEWKKNNLEEKLLKYSNYDHNTRINEALAKSPFINSETFYAAEIVHIKNPQLRTFKNSSTTTILIVICIISLIFSIFFVLLSDAINKRKN